MAAWKKSSRIKRDGNEASSTNGLHVYPRVRDARRRRRRRRGRRRKTRVRVLYGQSRQTGCRMELSD